MPDAVSYTHDAPERRPTRLWEVQNAVTALADFESHKETTCYTYGQFSLIDAVVALLDKTGPAHMDVCTWTVGIADMARVYELIEAGRILSVRWVVDQGFESRQPGYCEYFRHLYGDERIRTLRAHAKFILLRNEQWDIIIRTSMNLNQNTRFEHLDVTDDPKLSQWHRSVIDGIFETETLGDFKPKSNVEVNGVAAAEHAGKVKRGRVESRGRVNVGT
ncbi:hypothetical protein [Rhodococcoides fascians]|uniref:hypothetical protein n=1 Tax=Rhodococcoides fascians TaxID=1828 RepID=UPI0012D31E1C|nr:hypothetical protein [Rhodococcus fascians]